MFAPVEAQDHDGVALPDNFVDRIDNPNTKRLPGLFGEAVDPAAAVLDVGTAALVGDDQAGAGHVLPVFRIVQYIGEGAHVRRVQADNADAQVGRLGAKPGAEEGECGQGREETGGRGCHGKRELGRMIFRRSKGAVDRA